MKIEPMDHGPKPLKKRWRELEIGDYYEINGAVCRRGNGYAINVDGSIQVPYHPDSVVTVLRPPTDARWQEFLQDNFVPRIVEPETMPIRDMEPGQPFVLFGSIEGERFICGDHGAITRLRDGKVFTDLGDCQGIPVNGKFVEEDSDG